MPGVDRYAGAASARILTSDWGSLNDKLIAKFYPLKRSENGTWDQSTDVRTVSSAENFQVDDGYEVHCPITEGQMEMSANWNSPFEGAGAESKAPTLSAMLQSGTLTSTLQTFLDKFGGAAGTATAEKTLAALQSAQGRTGITKLNSTQTFNGAPPIKLNVTCHFRAVSDPISEVRAPLTLLQQWASPQYLSSDAVIASAIKNGGDQSALETIYPSVGPQIIAVRFGDMTYSPMVIESISNPITNPRDIQGVMISCSVQLSLATLTAWDRRDIQSLYL